MAEKGFIDEFDPYKDTLTDVINKFYEGKTKITRFASEPRRGVDYKLGNMTVAEAISQGEDGSASPMLKRLKEIEEKVARNEAKTDSIRTFRQHSHYVLGAAKKQLSEDHPLYKEIPTKEIKGPEAERFWGSIIPDKGQASVTPSIHPDALEGFERELKKYEKANKHDKAIVDAIRVMFGTGLRPSTITEMVYSEYFTTKKVLAVIPERVVFTDKETGEIIEDFTIPENRAKQEDAVKKVIQRTGIAKGPQEIGRSKAIMLNVPVDEEVHSAIARRMAANSLIPEFAKLLEDREGNEFELFMFTKPDGSRVTNADVNDVLRQIRVTYLDEDPRTGTMIEKGILYDAESQLFFDTLAPTTEEVKAAGEARGYKNLTLGKVGGPLFRGWYDSRLQAAGVSETSAKILQGRRLDIQGVGGYGHPTAGQVGKPIKNVAVNAGRWTASQSIPVTKAEIKQYGVDTAEEVKDLRGQIVASQIAKGEAPSKATANFRTNPNPANLEQIAVKEAPALREAYDLAKEVKAEDKSSAKLLENIEYKNNIVAELRGEPILDTAGEVTYEPTLGIPKESFAHLLDTEIWDIATDFTSEKEFEFFWDRHGNVLEGTDNVQVSDFLKEYNKFKPVTGRGTRGASMLRSVKGSPNLALEDMSPAQKTQYLEDNKRPWESIDDAEDRLFNNFGRSTGEGRLTYLDALEEEVKSSLDVYDPEKVGQLAPPSVAEKPIVAQTKDWLHKAYKEKWGIETPEVSEVDVTEPETPKVPDADTLLPEPDTPKTPEARGWAAYEAAHTPVDEAVSSDVSTPKSPTLTPDDELLEPIPDFLSTSVEEKQPSVLNRFLKKYGRKIPWVGGFIGAGFMINEALAEQTFRREKAGLLSMNEMEASRKREGDFVAYALDEAINPAPWTFHDTKAAEDDRSVMKVLRTLPEYKRIQKSLSTLMEAKGGIRRTKSSFIPPTSEGRVLKTKMMTKGIDALAKRRSQLEARVKQMKAERRPKELIGEIDYETGLLKRDDPKAFVPPPRSQQAQDLISLPEQNISAREGRQQKRIEGFVQPYLGSVN